MNIETEIKIDALPTILDILEKISAIENSIYLSRISSVLPSQYHDEGRYILTSDRNNRNIVRLMPTSQSPFTYYRGQSTYYESCMPTLYRNNNGLLPTESQIACNHLKICELIKLISMHPVFCELQQIIQVNTIALAQHYGLNTEYLDVTNNKWVAAFFASTKYDYLNDTYYPVGRDYAEGYGVMYISNNLDNMLEEFNDRLDEIGYQYFARPTQQSSFGFKMYPGENFNDLAYFDKFFFRHDIEASKIVYEMSYRQNRFIPQDPLSKLARQICDSKEVTRHALNLCFQHFYSNKAPEYLDEVCSIAGWTIREDNALIAQFSQAELEADWNEWNRFGREEIKSRILPIRPMTTFKLR